MWQPPLLGKSQQGQSDACHQPWLPPRRDLRNRILSAHLPSQFRCPVPHSLGESPGGGSSAVLLPETSLLIVPMYRVRALLVSLLRCSVGAFLVLYLSCFLSPRSLSSPVARCRSWLFIPFISRINGIGELCLQFVFLPEDFRGTLADDDAGSHGIAGGHARHDRAVCNAKVFDPVDLKLTVYDRHRIAPRFRGTRLMVVSGGRIANEVF